MGYSNIIPEKHPGSKGRTATDGQADAQFRLGRGWHLERLGHYHVRIGLSAGPSPATSQAAFFTEIMANHVATGNSLFREVLVRKDVDHCQFVAGRGQGCGGHFALPFSSKQVVRVDPPP